MMYFFVTKGNETASLFLFLAADGTGNKDEEGEKNEEQINTHKISAILFVFLTTDGTDNTDEENEEQKGTDKISAIFLKGQ